MSAGLWLLLGAVALVALVILEGRRQERIYGRSGRTSMMRTGLLEIQRHLEPERRVERMIEEEREETEQDDAGEGPPRDR